MALPLYPAPFKGSTRQPREHTRFKPMIKDDGKPLSKAERIRMLQEVYDKSLRWLLSQTECYKGKGTAAACTTMERARVELEKLMEGSDDQRQEMVFDMPAPWVKKDDAGPEN